MSQATSTASRDASDAPVSGRDRVLVQSRRDARSSDRARGRSMDAGWKALGWFGLLLAIIGAIDIGLYFYPAAFASPEWEFATVAAAISSLPLPTVGLAGLVAWLLARGSKGQKITGSVVLLLAATAVAAAYALFLLNLPMALNAAAGPQGPAIQRAIIRTTVMGVGFGMAYLVSAIVLLRHLSGRTPQ